MPEVTIKFEVDTCVDDCPFCKSSQFSPSFFCSSLSGELLSWSKLERESKPLSNCPYRK